MILKSAVVDQCNTVSACRNGIMAFKSSLSAQGMPEERPWATQARLLGEL